jgi:uncharacterized protein YycO
MEHLYTINRKIYKKLILVIGIILIFTSCANIPKDREWQPIKVVRDRHNELQIGDIIVKNKIGKRPLTWFGHAAMVVKEDTIGDYPRIGAKYYELDTYSWLYEDRNVMVFRYKHFDEKFKKKFLENAKKYSGRSYAFTTKTNTNTFYCSKYVWYIYYITAKDLGYDLDIDSDGGLLALPYDLIDNKEFDQIIF